MAPLVEMHTDDAKLAWLYQLYEAKHDLIKLIDMIKQIEDHPAATTAVSGTWVFIKSSDNAVSGTGLFIRVSTA
jgi:hypothetical protein